MFIKHDDKNLNMLRIAAFGMLAFYFYKVNKKEGTLGSVGGAGPMQVNTKKVVDSIIPWLPIEDAATKEVVKQSLNGFAEGFLKEKGIGTL